jgi:orotidine-5'-phosphate decarboxylase
MAQYWPFAGLTRHGSLRERLIVSLDMTDRREAMRLVERLGRVVGMFKVGRALFLGGGPDLIRELRKRGAEVFLDLKFHDNLTRAALEATRLGVKMFDIHPNGSVESMARMRLEVGRVCQAEGLRRPHILAVTMLARMRANDAAHEDGRCAEHLVEMARGAAEASLDGVFASLPEVSRLRNACGHKFIVVTCGVRMRDAASGAINARSAADALRAGADFIVVGSPIWRADEPVRTVRDLLEDIERALRGGINPAAESLAPRPL